jgi:hypothetical protein
MPASGRREIRVGQHPQGSRGKTVLTEHSARIAIEIPRD